MNFSILHMISLIKGSGWFFHTKHLFNSQKLVRNLIISSFLGTTKHETANWDVLTMLSRPIFSKRMTSFLVVASPNVAFHTLRRESLLGYFAHDGELCTLRGIHQSYLPSNVRVRPWESQCHPIQKYWIYSKR